jgi:fimbrial chaperone protein
MRGRDWIFALLLPALPAMADAPSTAMGIAPTLVQLKPGAAGLFYVTNHGTAPLTVEIQAMDWRQRDGRDVLSPSADFFTSPPVVTIAPQARQSVRLLATKPGAYRLLVSELPDPAADPGRVKVLLQFSVPVFAAPDIEKGLGVPALAFTARRDGEALMLSAVNHGTAPVKLSGPKLGGVVLDPGPVYLLPGARREFTVPNISVGGAASLHVTAHDVLSGRDFDTDVAP